MRHFWASFFEHLKGCGRSATLFMVTFAGLMVLVVVAAIIRVNELDKYLPPVLAGVLIYLVAWVGLAIRRARTRRSQRLEWRRLSFDEMRVARLKLRKEKKSAQGPNRAGQTPPAV
jgi:hypothetical protein